MSLSQIVRLVPGEHYGYSTVLRLVADANNYGQRLYAVRTDCCGDVLTKPQKWIVDSVRRGRRACPHCAARARLAARDTPPGGRPVTVGEVIGPVVVIGAGLDSISKRVRWHCCGREEILPHRRLYHLRHDAQSAQPQQQCRYCYAAARNWQVRDPLPVAVDGLPSGVLSAALAWPRPRLGA